MDFYKGASYTFTNSNSTTFKTDTSIIMASAKAFDFAGEVAIVTGAGSRMSGTFHMVLKCPLATL